MRRILVQLWAIGLVLTSLLLAGCGGDEPETPTPAPVAESSQMTSIIPTPAPTALPEVGTSTPVPVVKNNQMISIIPTPAPAPIALYSSVARPIPAILPDVLPVALYFLHDGQIQRLERDGVTVTRFTQEQEPITDFDVSPVDGRLAYVSGNRLIEANPQYGTKILKVDGDPIVPYDSTNRISEPHFSPDGSQIAFGMGGVNLIPVGETTEHSLILANLPPLAGEYGPASRALYHSPLEWSPDGAMLAVFTRYWWEGAEIDLIRLMDRSLLKITSDNIERLLFETNSYPFDPTLCCVWSWGRDGSRGFITSYSIDGPPSMGTGLTLVSAISSVVTPLVIGHQDLGELGQGVNKVFESDDGSLLSFAISFYEAPGYSLQAIEADGSRITPIADLGIFNSNLSEVLWARDGSGAVLRFSTGSPDERHELFWVSSRDGEIQQLPVNGKMLRWAPVIGQDSRWAVAETERAEPVPLEAGAPPQANPKPADDAPRLTALTTLNLRSGPGTLYPVVGSLAGEEPVGIVGVSYDHSWWQVAVATQDADTAWVLEDSDFVETQNADSVVFVTAPPPPDPVGRIFYPGWNPDGRPAVFFQELAAGSVPQLVVPHASQPSLSTDGTRLAVRLDIPSAIFGIGVWDMAAERVTALFNHQGGTRPRWNPNGDAIVFGSNRNGEQRGRVYVQPTMPGEPVRAIGSGMDPDWHPSVDLIAYQGCDITLIAYQGCDIAGDTIGIWTMDSQGREQTRITNGKSDARPVWSPSGETIVFMSESRDGNWEIYSVDAGGTVVTRLTNNPAIDGLPTVSPDGRQVAFLSSRGGEWGVWIMPIGGGSPERVLDLGVYLFNWLAESIDWTW